MKKQMLLKAALLISLLGTASVSAQTSDRPDGLRFVPDVPGQFRALTERPEPMGFHKGNTPDPSACRHYQGLARVDTADGTPFFLVTRSGNVPDDVPACPTGDSGAGNLIVVRMGSRDKNGERLRSNRLRKGVHVDNTPPPLEDKALTFYSFVHGGLVFRDGEGLPPRAYQHPGGMQLIGNVLAVAVEHPFVFPGYEAAPDPTLIMFFDVSNPEAPQFLNQFALRHPDGEAFEKAGVVAITPLPGGLYLMATTGGKGDEVHFFRSTIGDLSSPDLSWEFVDKTAPSVDDDPQQTLQFIREGNINGDLYLAGVRGHPVFGSDHDKIDLYLVHGQTPAFAPGEMIFQNIRWRGQPITTFPNTGGTRLANGAAASSFHISPSGELILYVTEHDNDGPDGTVKMGEWRHQNIVRAGSPTYLPTATVNGPFEVDEGSNVTLTGSAQPPIAKAWIQLFHETAFSSFNPVVDFDDYDLDDFDDFATLEFQNRPPIQGGDFFHNNKARSWKWFAPPGCSIAAIDLDGAGARILQGTGLMQEDTDLRDVLNDVGTQNMFEKVDKVEFLPGCSAYYNTAFVLQWDLDLDGSYETTGNSASFSALAVDGPSTVNVPAQAQHPSGGPAGYALATVNVRNVAPQLTQFHLTDSAGHEVNTQVPLVLTNQPLKVDAAFNDPGVLDHQTATLAWGDGSVEPQTSFTTFDEAFGDGTGAASHTHSYALAGSYSITLSVLDDDGGVDTEARVVRVVTPEQAVEEIISLLESTIAGTTDNKVRTDLEKALKALAGSNDHSNNGALNKIKAGNNPAAIAFLQQAIASLRKALAGGANVTTQIALLEQVLAALSAP